MKKKVVIFIDLIAAKNRLQLDVINEMGLEPVVFVNIYKPASNEYLGEGGTQFKLADGFIPRLKQVYRFLKDQRRSTHHLEIYPGGRFSFLYLLLAKYFSLKTICAERGDLLYYQKGGYSAFVRWSMYICYKFADVIWYREPYMRAKLETIRKDGLVFLHNAIDDHHKSDDASPSKTIDFLWLNRVIPERKSKWFLNILGKSGFAHTKNMLVGLQEGTVFNTDVDHVKNNLPPNLQAVPYSPTPDLYFQQARFFVLPSDVVFANHALLEAMSFGVVPIVSRTQGADLIVDDEENGFLFEYNEQAFEAAMQKALNLSEETYRKYSLASKEKIRRDFSAEKFRSNLQKLYGLVD
ncbi:MAG: glycosyltransferase family 1 protein [Chitinophagaceae bacterium]|nr:MAG: glycosyltransferase family 1 protein [Chitinophagaceae bacterium]